MISFKHKFIFLKTKKVAGTSVAALLRHFTGAKDIVPCVTPRDEYFSIAQGLYSQNYSKSKEGEKHYTELVRSNNFEDAVSYMQDNMDIIYHSHMTASQIKNFIERSGYKWEDFFTFTIDRNPYDWMLSACAYSNVNYNKGIKASISKEQVIKRACKMLSSKGFSTNMDMYSVNETIMVDEIIKYEELGVQLPKLFTRLGLDLASVELPSLKVNARHLDANHFFDDGLKDEIYARFKKTFEILGYQK